MRKLILPLNSRKTYKELQFYDEGFDISIMLVTFKDGKEVKRKELGKIAGEESRKLLRNMW